MKEVTLSVKMKMQREIPLRKYKGTVEILGHELPYKLEYIPTDKEDEVNSRLTWDNSNGKFQEVYEGIMDQVQDILRQEIIQYEAKLNILQKKMAAGILPQMAGGSFLRTKAPGDIASADMGKVQIETEHKIKISKKLESILRNTPPPEK